MSRAPARGSRRSGDGSQGRELSEAEREAEKWVQQKNKATLFARLEGVKQERDLETARAYAEAARRHPEDAPDGFESAASLLARNLSDFVEDDSSEEVDSA